MPPNRSNEFRPAYRFLFPCRRLERAHVAEQEQALLRPRDGRINQVARRAEAAIEEDRHEHNRELGPLRLMDRDGIGVGELVPLAPVILDLGLIRNEYRFYRPCLRSLWRKRCS